jgi:hypothetical protein
LAVLGGASPAADYVVAIANIGIDHAVASDLEGISVVVDCEIGFEGQRLGVLDRLDGRAGCHYSKKRY